MGAPFCGTNFIASPLFGTGSQALRFLVLGACVWSCDPLDMVLGMARKPSTTYEPGDEPWRCCAKSKTTQKRCGQRVVPGRRVCRYHGGLGGSAPIHGRYSKALGRFRAAYEESRQDPSLLDLRETLALMDLVVKKAVSRASESDTPEFRARALELFGAVRVSVGQEDHERQLDALEDHLERGVSEDKALEALAKAAERLSRRQEKAWSIRLDAANAINARDLVAVLARFADIVLDECEKDAAGRIIRRIDGEVLGTGPAALGLEAGNAT